MPGRPGYLVSYPTDFLPAVLADGFIQRVLFRLEHDNLPLSARSLRGMFRFLTTDEKARALQIMKAEPKLQFAYHVLRNKAKIKKKLVMGDFVEKLVDKVAGIPYGNGTFLSISFIRDKNDELLLSLRVFRGYEGKAYPTRFGMGVPAYLATDIRNALDRLASRHKSKLLTAREVATKKYATDSHSNRLGNVGTKKDEDEGAQ